MQFKLFIIYTFLSSIIHAQDGFNQSYELNYVGCGLNNTTLVNDTVIVYGTGKLNNSSSWGIVFLKLDTLGNIHANKHHIDSMGDSYILEKNYNITKTSNNNFVLVSNLHSRNWGILMKLDNNGNQIFVKEYPDSSAINIRQKEVIETSTGYLVAGNKQKENGFEDIFVMQTDIEGNKLWEMAYGRSNQHDRLHSFVVVDDNTYVIGATKSSAHFTPLEHQWFVNYIFAIDSLGEVKWEWNASVDNEAGVMGLNRTTDGGWIYGTSRLEISQFGDFNTFPKIVRRDSKMNLLWESEVPVDSLPVNFFIDVKPTIDGDWVGVGNWFMASSTPNYIRGGCLYKVSDDGDFKWTLCDSTRWETPVSRVDELAGMVSLPSGSIIAAGSTRRYSPDPARSYGWVIKVNKDGCVDTLCNILSPQINVVQTPQINIFPNPATDFIQIEYDDFFDVEIFNVQGQLLKRKTNLTLEASVDITDLDGGVYFMTLITQQGRVTRKIIVQR